jgi:hypothetical protein
MNGETLFRALVACRENVMGLAMSWTKADTARVSSALMTGSWRLLPRSMRDLLDRLADEIQRATT